MHSAIPTLANVYGEMLSRKAPTWGTISPVRTVEVQTRAYVEGLSFVVEELVQAHHTEGGGRTARSISKRHVGFSGRGGGDGW